LKLRRLAEEEQGVCNLFFLVPGVSFNLTMVSRSLRLTVPCDSAGVLLEFLH
jgi:hypothetical protein